MARAVKTRGKGRLAATAVAAFVVVSSLVGYGVAQSTQVTQAEWAVYMVQGLGLDWNMPPQATANDYVARLLWSTSIEFPATRVLPGSSASLAINEDAAPAFINTSSPTAEALYRISTVQPGDYNFRVNLAGGTAMLKVGSALFEITQPEEEFRWVDLSRVSLDPGEHTVSLLLSEGARAEGLSIVPPCLRRIEPLEGWQPLENLTFAELAVTVARALDLEYDLPKMGPEIKIRGEEFQRTLELPVHDQPQGTSEDPFWLSTGGNIVTARARFTVPEHGFYSIEARYLSSTPVRWVSNGCLKIVTCAFSGEQGMHWRRVLVLELDAGEQDLEVTLPPDASLDQVVIQRRDPSIEAYIQVAADEGFRIGTASQVVRRREAMAAALRLSNRFEGRTQLGCQDTLVAMEQAAFLRMAVLRNEQDQDGDLNTFALPVPDVAASGAGANLFPKGGTDVAGSPIVPVPTPVGEVSSD
ncbi:MAG TPA: hypothetical protein VGC53_07860 [Vicinamibacteria bacterium]|jgi:hypothetical protein